MSGARPIRVFLHDKAKEAMVWNGRSYSYAWLVEQVGSWEQRIRANGIQRGTVTEIQGDFSPNAVALFLALLNHGCVIVPLTASAPAPMASLRDLSQVEVVFALDGADTVTIDCARSRAAHPLYEELRRRDHAGLVLFSSGSTGTTKAVVHDLVGVLKKFDSPRRCLRAVAFLRFDHIGGVNTMLHVLSNGGCLVIVDERTPDEVLQAVSRHRVELLPTSPTFINLILLSEAYTRYDLSSLKTISYGTEPMPESTLKRFHRLFPHIRMQQTYGLSEVGILHSKSLSSDSLWVRVGGAGFETRVVSGMLQIKADSAMLGYLNAPSPFTEDGWLQTGDMVEVDGDHIKFLGRNSAIINVGGEKVFPAEVESVIHELDNVAEVTVYPEKSPILGNMVCAKVRLKSPQEPAHFIAQLKRHCRQRLARFKVPVRVTITSDPQHTLRFKQRRPVL